MMSDKLVNLTTPVGEISIIKSKIIAVVSVGTKDNGFLVLSNVYTEGLESPFNVLEDKETVCGKIT